MIMSGMAIVEMQQPHLRDLMGTGMGQNMLIFTGNKN